MGWLFIPCGGRVGGPDIPTREIAEMAHWKVYGEMVGIFRDHTENFNSARDDTVRKKVLEQIGFMRGITFPDFGKIRHQNSTGIRFQSEVLPMRYVVVDSDVAIEKLMDVSENEYVVVKRFPMSMLTISYEVVDGKDKYDYDIAVSATWKTGSEESASFDSSQL